ncbi:hypothetical protein NliqN6_1546 [Naganishia liquefaciens]|uniref:Uncharacterized protein n=1 Tax=Naganishia liquefaciens TaxID=104408 RepID=A0A8H3TRY5_9TREE|nr:hypothetical protein NliqN6_1546 [Naganishia liquefaciens]
MSEVAATFRLPSLPPDSDHDYRGPILKRVDRSVLFGEQGFPNHVSTLSSPHSCSEHKAIEHSPDTPDFDALFPSSPGSTCTAAAGPVQIQISTLSTSNAQVDAKDEVGKELSDNVQSLRSHRRRRSTSSHTSKGSPTASGCLQIKKAKLTASIHAPNSPT